MPQGFWLDDLTSRQQTTIRFAFERTFDLTEISFATCVWHIDPCSIRGRCHGTTQKMQVNYFFIVLLFGVFCKQGLILRFLNNFFCDAGWLSRDLSLSTRPSCPSLPMLKVEPLVKSKSLWGVYLFYYALAYLSPSGMFERPSRKSLSKISKNAW